LSQAAYRGRHRPPAGRHRAARSPRSSSSSTSSLPRLTRSGFLLPTAAAATLVLTATGAHIGASAGSPGANPAPSATTLTASGLLTEDSIERDVTDRAARDSARSSSPAGGTDAAAESGRADQLDAADTADRAQAQADATTAAAAAAAKAAADAQAANAAAAQAQTDAAAQAQAQAGAATAAAHSWVPFIDGGGYQLTSGFGMRWGSMHPGQDFAVPVGTPVKAMSSGTIIFAGWQGGYGNKVEIQYWDGTVSWFCHNSKLLVAQGDTVTTGEVVSMSGNTGHSTGPHIHVEIHPNNGSPIPPLPWLKKMGTMP
jgi:murein DD-endopeptidase MepM/ murein hydrolase activator NlpD